jgi:hypothetical protein
MLQGSWIDSALLSHRGKKFRIVQAASNSMYFPSNRTEPQSLDERLSPIL